MLGDQLMNSTSAHLAPQSQSGFAAPPLCQGQTAEGSVSGLKMTTAVPNNSISYNPSITPGGATGSDQLLMLKMLAQQVSTAPSIQDAVIPAPLRMVTTQQRIELPALQQPTPELEGAKGPGVAAALSMLPSPLPLDLSSTGMQPQLGGLAYSSQAHQQQQLLRFGLQQPQLQLHYGANPQRLQYHTLQQQLQPTSHQQQQQHLQLQLALHQQQQQQQLGIQQQQQRVSELSAIHQAAAAAVAPAPSSLTALLQTALDQQPMPQEQQEPVPAEGAQDKHQDGSSRPVQQHPPEQQQQQQAKEEGPQSKEHGQQADQLQQQQQQQQDDAAAADGDADAQDLGARDAPEPLSATASGDMSGQPGLVEAGNPNTSAAATARGSKYGAKRAAALKRQGYTNSVPGPNGNGKSNFRGVFWDRKNSRWRAQVGFNNRKIFMGYFGEPAEAARAYDKKVVQLHGALAKTNFPLEEYAEDLRAFNQQQQQQQIISQQTTLLHRPRRVRRRHHFNSDSSEVSDGAADDEYMDTDMGGVVPPQGGLGMYPQGAAGYGGPVLPDAGNAPHHMGPGGAGYYGQGPMGGFMGGYPPQVSADPAAAGGGGGGGGGAGAPGADMLQQMFSAAKPAAAGADGDAAADLPADVAAAVAAAAALVGVSADEQQDPAAAAAEPAVGLKRKRTADESNEETPAVAAVAAAAQLAAGDATIAAPTSSAPPAADDSASDARDPAAEATAEPVQAPPGGYTEQLPAIPSAAAEPWQTASWMQQHQQQSGASVSLRPYSGSSSRRQYSWHGGELDGAAAAAAAGHPTPVPPLQRQYSGSHRQYSWHGDDVAGGMSGARAMSPPAWLPTPPPHLTWQDHMKNLEASLINAGKKDADKDSRDKDSNRDSNITSPNRPVGAGAGSGGVGGGYYRAGGSKTPGKSPQGGAAYGGRWQHILADLAAAEGGDAPGKQRRKGGWQQQQPADTDGLSALLAVAAAAEAGDTDNPDAGADALAGLLSIAAAAGASNATPAGGGGAYDEGQVVLTKEQEQEWLALTSALAAALIGTAEPPPAAFNEAQPVTAELLTSIRVLAQRTAAAGQQQGGSAAEHAEVGLPFEILSTVEQWMLEHVDQQPAPAAGGGQQQAGGAGYALDSEVSIAEALACASEAGIPAEVRQMYLLVLYHVLSKKEQQLSEQLQELGGATQAKQQQQEQQQGEVDGRQGAAGMEVDAAEAAAAVQPEPAPIAHGHQRAGSYDVDTAAAQQHQQQPPTAPVQMALDDAVKPAPAAAAAGDRPADSSHAAFAAAAAADKPLLPEQAAVGVMEVMDAAMAAAMPVAVISKGTLHPTNAAAVVAPHASTQRSNTPAAVVSPGQTEVAAAGDAAAAGLTAPGYADPAGAAGASPDGGGVMSRWGSGTEGIMDVCQG